MHEHGYQIDTAPEVMPCPRCGCMTKDLMYIAFWRRLIVVGHIHWGSRESLRACPSCTRGHILKKTACLIIESNLFWPFYVLPRAIAMMALSFYPGHTYQSSTKKITHFAMVNQNGDHYLL